MKTATSTLLAMAASLVALPATAQDSGFLTDYSLLQTREGDEVWALLAALYRTDHPTLPPPDDGEAGP